MKVLTFLNLGNNHHLLNIVKVEFTMLSKKFNYMNSNKIYIFIEKFV